jgi:hypothetical protein
MKSEIDGEEAEPGVGCPAHTAVEGPGGAIYGQRERVDIGIRDKALPLPLLPFGYIGNEEKEKEIGQYDRQQDPGREHLVSSIPSI